MSDKLFEANIAYLDLIELVKYHAPYAYEKIFKHKNTQARLQLLIDRDDTLEHEASLVVNRQAQEIQSLQKALSVADRALEAIEDDLDNTEGFTLGCQFEIDGAKKRARTAREEIKDVVEGIEK